MFLRTTSIQKKYIIGKSTTTSLLNNQTAALWSSFMPRRKEIKSIVNQELYSIQLYPSRMDYAHFNPAAAYTLWAGSEVSDSTDIPQGMELLELPAGNYAVFLHSGTPMDFKKTMDFIFLEWLPNTEYEIDHRPHFEVLGKKYKHNDPNSEEEVWIPIVKSAK